MSNQNLIYLMEELSKLSLDAVTICQFRELNLVALRKVLKKYDRNFPYAPDSYSALLLRRDLSNPKTHLYSLVTQDASFFVYKAHFYRISTQF